MTVRVVTDSTSDLPPEVAAALGVTVVPLNVHFGTQVYLDGVDLPPDEFYRRLASAPALPTTSQPSVGAFVEVYERLSQEADAILSLHISSRISGTYNSAMQAREAAKVNCPIEVVDTMQASMGLGMIVRAAAEAAQNGKGLEEATEVARGAMPRSQFYGLVDTLEYLRKGGRIGKAQAMLGSLLRIKPLLIIRDGEAHELGRTRTRSKGIDRLCQVAQEFAPLEDLCVLHATTPDEAQEIAQRLGHLVPQGQVIIARIGLVVGTYLGPGSLGIALRQGSQRPQD